MKLNAGAGMLKRILLNLVVVAAGILAALALFEIGLRIANRKFPYFYCYDRYRGWALKPGASGLYDREGVAFVRINRDGFRGPDEPRLKPPNTFRVAVVGDSYTEAMQVPYRETFCAVMQRHLAECPELRGKNIQVLDFGVDGYGTAQELITLRRQVWAYSPDVVVLEFFPGNDIRNNSVVLEGDQCRPFYVYRNGKLALTGPFVTSRSFRLWCMARFDYRTMSLLTLAGRAWSILTEPSQVPSAENPEEVAINYSIYKPPADAAWRAAWQVTEGLLGEMNNEVRAHGARFLVATLDVGIQTWPDPKVRAKFMKHLGVTTLSYPAHRIEAIGRADGFPVLALARPLQMYAEEHNVYLHGFSNTPRGFGHWNAIGHRVAGRLIAAKLCSMLQGAGATEQTASDSAAHCTGSAVPDPAKRATRNPDSDGVGESGGASCELVRPQ
jgi:hypothetical protein